MRCSLKNLLTQHTQSSAALLVKKGEGESFCCTHHFVVPPGLKTYLRGDVPPPYPPHGHTTHPRLPSRCKENACVNFLVEKIPCSLFLFIFTCTKRSDSGYMFWGEIPAVTANRGAADAIKINFIKLVLHYPLLQVMPCEMEKMAQAWTVTQNNVNL